MTGSAIHLQNREKQLEYKKKFQSLVQEMVNSSFFPLEFSSNAKFILSSQAGRKGRNNNRKRKTLATKPHKELVMPNDDKEESIYSNVHTMSTMNL